MVASWWRHGGVMVALVYAPKPDIEYWNKLPHHVKDSTSVEMFKSRLESHKKACISDPNTRSSNFWELSDILLNKIDDSNRNAHIDFLTRNPEIAKHKKTNIFYVK